MTKKAQDLLEREARQFQLKVETFTLFEAIHMMTEAVLSSDPPRLRKIICDLTCASDAIERVRAKAIEDYRRVSLGRARQ